MSAELTLAVAIRRLALRAAYRVLRVYWRIAHPRTAGAKCLLPRAGQILLIRHTYGDRSVWRLPGGTVRRGEPPETTIRRELREEIGIEIRAPRKIAEIATNVDGKRDTVHCFTAEPAGGELRLDGTEIEEARWFAVDALPTPREPFVEPALEATSLAAP